MFPHFLHYAGTPEDVVMREVYSGMYISWDGKDFRLMPDYQHGFPGIILPHKTYGEVCWLVRALGSEWDD